MHDTDYATLKRIAAKLAIVAASDADPDNWTCPGIKPSSLTESQRGDAYWCRKLAGQTLSVLTKVLSVTGIIERSVRDGVPPDDAETDKQMRDTVSRARRDAAKMLKLVHSRERDVG